MYEVNKKTFPLIPKFTLNFMDPCFFEKSNQELSEQWRLC